MNEIQQHSTEYAHRRLLEAGFKHAYSSAHGNSRYYAFPDRCGLLRLSDHGQKSKDISPVPIYGRITVHNGSVPKAWETLERQVAQAIGFFMLKSPHKSREIDNEFDEVMEVAQ